MPLTLPLNNMMTTKYAQDYVFDPFGNLDVNEALKIKLSNTEERAGQCILASALDQEMYDKIIGTFTE